MGWDEREEGGEGLLFYFVGVVRSSYADLALFSGGGGLECGRGGRTYDGYHFV